MANTFELISSVTVGSGGAASIDFTSIPATYTDLSLMFSVRNATEASNSMFIKLNTSSSNFNFRILYGTGSGTGSANAANNEIGLSNSSSYTATTFGNGNIYIPNYAGSTNKSISVDTVVENNATTSYAAMYASLWSNTAAITSLGINPTSGNFAQYSTAYLYGVKNA